MVDAEVKNLINEEERIKRSVQKKVAPGRAVSPYPDEINDSLTAGLYDSQVGTADQIEAKAMEMPSADKSISQATSKRESTKKAPADKKVDTERKRRSRVVKALQDENRKVRNRVGYGALGAGAVAGIAGLINSEREKREEEAALTAAGYR